ncbi:MAG: hypothetical protein EBT97_09080 [Actinobacteria bacterium]|nr:hypothetical protein [Actinomycetota bacterium]
MPAPTNVKVTFTGDTSQLTAASKQASAAIASTGQAADKAAAKIKAISDDAADVGDKFGKAGGSAAKMAGALSLVSPAAADSARNLADLADVGELAAEAAGALGLSMSSMLAIAAPVAVAVAALGAVWYTLSQQAKAAEEAQNKAAEAAQKAAEIGARINESQTKWRDAAAIASGKATEAELKLRDAVSEVTEAYKPAIDAERARLDTARATREANERIISSEAALTEAVTKSGRTRSEVLAAAANARDTAAQQEASATARLTGLNQQYTATVGDAARALQGSAKAEEKKAKATAASIDMEKAAEAAAQARREAEEDLAKLLEERRQKEEEYAAAIGTITGEREDAEQSLLTTEQQIEKERQAARARVLAAASQALELARGNGIKEAQIREETQAALAAIDAEAGRNRLAAISDQQEREDALMDAYRAETAAKQKAAQEEARAGLVAFASGVVDLTGQILMAVGDSSSTALSAAVSAAANAASQIEETDRLLEGLGLATVDTVTLTGDALTEAYRAGEVAAEDLTEQQKRQIESQLLEEKAAAEKFQEQQKEAALEAWRINHAAAVAEALVQVPLAATKALGSAPFPLNVALAALSGALAAASAAKVAAQQPPSFRTGYMPDQQLAYIEPGSEMVVPASGVQAMGGRQAAEQAFAGVAPSGGAQTTYFTMGHRAFSALVQGSAGRPGPLRDLTIRPGAGRRLRR